MMRTTSINVRSRRNLRRACFQLTTTTERGSPKPNIHHCASKYVRRRGVTIAVAAVVVTVIEAAVVLRVPFAGMLAGVKVHVASEGSPAQARLIVPLKLVEVATVIDV